MRKFFVSCGLGLEKDLLEELLELWPYFVDLEGHFQIRPVPEFSIEEGGIEFMAPFEVGLQVNYFSKLANRVLLRLDQFKADHFSTLEKRIQRIPWADYIKTQNFEVEVSSQASRLYHKKRIEEFVVKKIHEKLPNLQSASKYGIYLRFDKDICQVSLDTSGEHLHKRGFADLKGEAPLRETLASWIVRKMIHDVPLGKLKTVQWIDPMCGSGTLLFEGLLLHTPQLLRKYSFQEFLNCPKILIAPSYIQKNFSTAVPLSLNYLGLDVQEKMVGVANTNKQRLFSRLSFLESVNLNFYNMDLFKLNEEFKAIHLNPSNDRWVMVNPPYGERLKANHDFNEILEQITRSLKPQKIALLSPPFQLNFSSAGRFTKREQWPVLHGGLRLKLVLLSET